MVTSSPELNLLPKESFDNFMKSARQLRKLTHDLQDISMSLRMVPYQGISEEKKGQFQGKAKGEVIGKCPRCGADVREGKVNFYCSDRKCAFTLWKNDKFLASQGKKMDKVAAKKFLSKGKIHYKDLVSRKTGRQYEATVEMVDPGEGNVQFNLIFPQR